VGRGGTSDEIDTGPSCEIVDSGGAEILPVPQIRGNTAKLLRLRTEGIGLMKLKGFFRGDRA